MFKFFTDYAFCRKTNKLDHISPEYYTVFEKHRITSNKEIIEGVISLSEKLRRKEVLNYGFRNSDAGARCPRQGTN